MGEEQENDQSALGGFKMMLGEPAPHNLFEGLVQVATAPDGDIQIRATAPRNRSAPKSARHRAHMIVRALRFITQPDARLPTREEWFACDNGPIGAGLDEDFQIIQED